MSSELCPFRTVIFLSMKTLARAVHVGRPFRIDLLAVDKHGHTTPRAMAHDDPRPQINLLNGKTVLQANAHILSVLRAAIRSRRIRSRPCVHASPPRAAGACASHQISQDCQDYRAGNPLPRPVAVKQCPATVNSRPSIVAATSTYNLMAPPSLSPNPLTSPSDVCTHLHLSTGHAFPGRPHEERQENRRPTYRVRPR